ncbi:MAG: hypothetical protein ACLFSV_05920 [Alkalispirochaeta sp.]
MNLRDVSPLRNKETLLGVILLTFAGVFLMGVAISRYRGTVSGDRPGSVTGPRQYPATRHTTTWSYYIAFQNL